MRTSVMVGLVIVGLVVVGGAGAACSAAPGHQTLGTGGRASSSSEGSGATESSAAGPGGAGQGGSVTFAPTTTGGATVTSTGLPCTVTDVNADMDGDGWTPAEGDCNDCDPNVNPGAIDTVTVVNDVTILGNEDCQNTPGSIPGPCDDGLAVDDPDPLDAAKAVELCTPLTDPKKWGLKSAQWVLPDGSPVDTLSPQGTSLAQAQANYALGHGLLSAFGPNVNAQGGRRMLGLSSGTARQPTDVGYRDVSGFDKEYTVGSPMGFPKESPACPGVTTGEPHDAVALEVDLVAPTNATGFSFSFDFFTYEWPGFICSQFNDFFVALLYPIPAGQADGNISFDSQGNPVSVNNAFLEVCGCAPNGPPCLAGGKTFPCSLGDGPLLDTGFGADTATSDHGSTSWLQTRAPVKGHQEITLRWAVYDSGDGILDTTVLVDDFQWIATPGAVSVGTSPIDQPK